MSWALVLLFNFFIISRNIDLEYCDIKGNVKNPGVYLVEDGDVINDIILKAGGLKKNSYVRNINLSKRVTDEMVINIITIDEYEELIKECPVCECEVSVCEDVKEEITTTNETTTTTLVTTTNMSTTQVTTTKINIATTSELRININEALIDELVKLPGVGEITAKKIIEYRTKTPFSVIEDILNVSGIGDKLFAKIKDYITV